MQNYELLFILPGTMAESETAPIVTKVKELIERNHGENIEVETMDKKRLAYPIKHIRYGYFFLVFFKAEPKDAHQMRSDLRLLPELLRGVIQKHDSASTMRQIDFGTNFGENVPASQNQSIQVEETFAPKEEKEEVVEVKEEEVAVTPTETEEVKVEETKTEEPKKEEEKAPKTVKKTTKKAVNLEDIDKKLDEILDIDLSNV